MNHFIQKYEEKTIGVLSGFDRLVLRGTLRGLAFTAGMMSFLSRMGVLLKDFGGYVQKTSERLKAASCEAARRLERPIVYLPSAQTRKEDMARQIAQRDRIREGLICILTCVEPCRSYEVHRDRSQKKLVLEPRLRKCLYLYHYWIDPFFGLMHGRIQSWFPFGIQICLNGREWLARQMDRQGMAYRRRENCFPWIEDLPRAQQWMDRLPRISWPSILRRIARQLNPAQREILGGTGLEYYWSVHQSEWATDVLFKSSAALASIYPGLVRGGIAVFSSRDVMRFLGKKPRGNFQGEVISDYQQRPEGIRVKHQLKQNSVKIYDKQGSVLRVETTINDPSDFRVFRPKQDAPEGPCQWQAMRKGIADLRRRTEVSQACNERYLDGLASLSTDQPLADLLTPVCRPTQWKGRRVRALQPWSPEDRSLLQAINRGEFALNGIRNRDLVAILFPRSLDSAEEKCRASGRVTRKLRLLRAHGILRKVPRTHRYVLTKRGRQITVAALQYQDLTLKQLQKTAA
jgi:hypothetical protein